MMKNRHLSKAVGSQKFYEFRTKLKVKCDENGIGIKSRSQDGIHHPKYVTVVVLSRKIWKAFRTEYTVVIVAMSRIGILTAP